MDFKKQSCISYPPKFEASPRHCQPPVNYCWSVRWFACVQRSTCTSCRTPPSTESHANPFLWIWPGFGRQNWLPRQRPLRDRKPNFKSFIHSHGSTNPANLVKIVPVDVEMIGLTKSLKIKSKIKMKRRQNITS